MAAPLIISPSLSLSELRDEDRPALVAHLGEREIADSTLRIPYPYTDHDARAWIGIARKKNAQAGKTIVWAIRDHADALIGCIGFDLEGDVRHKADLGYWLAKPYWGRGIMTRVVKKVTEVGLQSYGWVRLSASVFDFNAPSARVLEKCGFALEACLRKHYNKNGRYFDAKVYGIIQ